MSACLPAQDLHNIKPVQKATRKGGEIHDGLWGRKSQFSLRVWPWQATLQWVAQSLEVNG